MYPMWESSEPIIIEDLEELKTPFEYKYIIKEGPDNVELIAV